MLILDIFLYGLATVYFVMILSDSNGPPRPWWFPLAFFRQLVQSITKRKQAAPSELDDDVAMETLTPTTGVAVQNLCKVACSWLV
jgi:hypothetical protein